MGATPVGVGGVIVWLELNGLGEVGDGAVEIKRLEMRGPPSEVCGGIIGVGFNQVGVIRDRAVNSCAWIRSAPSCAADCQSAKENVRRRVIRVFTIYAN